ncbi:glycosyltransferase [Flavihumibacter petaseus]|uniref:Putative glycosyltransferase n=1 Tax=Flavihumibacter petaseus NBRC 106054 TaxID=1220578 RepID=A0A0E9MUM6_9BACT|nr:glycosyltransferase [Flavihumibacter petaseus]GAO41279.1 putative glycosyltransferase [Flavihumibacter petaseus NBRC 106054]
MDLLQFHWNGAWTAFLIFCIVTIIQLLYYWGIFSRLAFYRKKTREQNQQHPVSVIICARDEAANLARNLPGVLFQQYPTTHELVVVNHNSQDDTRFLLEEFRKTFKSLEIVNLEQEAKGIPGKKYPLSIGIREANHEIVLLTDADCVPASEFWIHRMQDAYENGVDIVLGYSPYHKKPGLLNKLIRFETFHTGMQYLSFALAGMPYMGVGRNLSYKRQLFLANKGFSNINHLPGGDDDLFIHKVARGNNTRIVIDPEAFTLSEPKQKFGDWLRQKNRHYSTGKYYSTRFKWMLGAYSFTQFIYYPALLFSLFLFDWKLTLAVFGLRFLSQAYVSYQCMKKLEEKDLWPWWWMLDIWMFFYYCIFAPAIWKKPRQSWV